MGSGYTTTPDALALGAQPDLVDGVQHDVVPAHPGFAAQQISAGTRSIAVLGLGYVGLPTGIGLATGGAKVTWIDVS
jgi:hypothetical protein